MVRRCYPVRMSLSVKRTELIFLTLTFTAMRTIFFVTSVSSCTLLNSLSLEIKCVLVRCIAECAYFFCAEKFHFAMPDTVLGSFDNDVLHAARECQAAFGRLYKARVEPLNAQIAHLLATSEAALVDAWAKQALGLPQQSPTSDKPTSSSPPQGPKSSLPPWLRSSNGVGGGPGNTVTGSPPASNHSPPLCSLKKQPHSSGFEPWKSPGSSSLHSNSSSSSSHNYSFSPNSPPSPNESASFLPAAILSRTTTSLPRPMASLTDHSPNKSNNNSADDGGNDHHNSRRNRSHSSPRSIEISDESEENDSDLQNGATSSKKEKTSPNSADMASRNASMGRIGSLREQRRLLQAQVLRRMSQDEVGVPGNDEDAVKDDDNYVDEPSSFAPLKQDQEDSSPDVPVSEAATTSVPSSPAAAGGALKGKQWRSLGSNSRRHQRSAATSQDALSPSNQSKAHASSSAVPLSPSSSSSSSNNAAAAPASAPAGNTSSVKAKIDSTHPPPSLAAQMHSPFSSSFQPRSYLPPPPKTTSTIVSSLLSSGSAGSGSRGRRSQSMASVLPQTSTLYSSNGGNNSGAVGNETNHGSSTTSSGNGNSDSNNSNSDSRGPKSVAAILKGLGLGDFVEGFEAEGFLFEEDILAVRHAFS